jgi:hypothetical protein
VGYACVCLRPLQIFSDFNRVKNWRNKSSAVYLNHKRGSADICATALNMEWLFIHFKIRIRVRVLSLCSLNAGAEKRLINCTLVEYSDPQKCDWLESVTITHSTIIIQFSLYYTWIWKVPQRLMCWRLSPQPIQLWRGGGNFRRWDLVGRNRSLGIFCPKPMLYSPAMFCLTSPQA